YDAGRRFQLRIHTGFRQDRIFSLKAAKGGLKIPEVDAPVPPEKQGHMNAAMSDRGGRMMRNKSTMAGMAIALTIFLKHPVITTSTFIGKLQSQSERSLAGLGTEGIGLLLSNARRSVWTTGRKHHWPSGI